MSGFSTESECPNCGENCDMYTDYKPFDYVSLQCYHCGLLITPQITYMTLKNLNSYRKDNNLSQLRKKPIQDFKY